MPRRDALHPLRRPRDCRQPRQQALTDLNGQLAHVLSDISAVTGMPISRALLDGERDPAPLAAFTAYRSRASTATLVKRLEGHGREAWRVTLRHALALYAWYPPQMAACAIRPEAHFHSIRYAIMEMATERSTRCGSLVT